MAFMTRHEPRERPAPLTGPIKRRNDARIKYGEIVTELEDISDVETLEIYLLTIGEELIQFENELPYFWNGGDMFDGLDAEIKKAWRRVNASW